MIQKYITSQCSKLSACLSQSGKLVMMFLIPIKMNVFDFRGRFKHVFALLRHICTHKKESRL